MSSPETSLRRRGRGSIPDHSAAGSDGFGSFVEAPTFLESYGSTSPARKDTHQRPDLISIPSSVARVSNSDEWSESDLLGKFSPPLPNKQAPPQRRSIGSRGASSEWSDWDSFLAAHTLPKAGKTEQSSNGQHGNSADDAFFDAFEIATQQNRGPSPPIIDLRDVERKMDLKNKPKAVENDFFSRFESAPESALGRSNPLVLEPEQLDSIRDARLSPMAVTPSGTKESYFGPAEPKAINRSKSGIKPDPSSSTSPTSPSSWGGSIRRTWSTLRGLPSDIANHLPSTTDFLVPPEENEATAPAQESNPGGGLFFATEEPRRDSSSSQHEKDARPRGSLVHASDYSQSTPFGASSTMSTSGFSAGAAADNFGAAPSGGRMRARDLFVNNDGESASNTQRRGPLHSNTAIDGAPGFDTTSTRKWNTGHWTLDDSNKKDKRVIPVTLSDRREETDSVVEQWHASRIQASLPPRLQLGKNWKLLYSLDQHGISLQTLYHRVGAGLDPSRSSSGNADGEGWLRGASTATREALGVGHSKEKIHVGGGLSSVSDAGLVVAIKDENDNVFGAFVNEKLRPQQHYYGSGECFLWKTTGTADDKSIAQFRWTGKNDYMVLSETTFLSVGGGNGKFGLWIDGALEKGVSDCCPAFDNDCLCDSVPKGQGTRDAEKRFTCYGLEVWAVGLD